MSPGALTPTDDPYAPKPSLWRDRPDWVAAQFVFVLTVVLAVISFPPFKAPEFAYAMLVPGALWAYRRPRFKLYVVTLLAAQAVAWTIILGWLHHVTWVGLFLLGPFVGAWIGTWYLAAWWTLPRLVGRPTFTRLAAVLGLAGVWVIIEWTRTWLFGGFPWLPLAASQWERATILQISALTGAYGVSFVLVVANLGFAAYAHRLFWEGATGFGKRSQEFFLALFLLMACVSTHFQEGFNRGRYTAPLARVAFVQPYIPQEVKWDPAKLPSIMQVLESTTMAATVTRPDLVLWPEAVTPMSVRDDVAIKAFTESLSTRVKAPLLLGSIAIDHAGAANETWYNGAFLITPDAGLAEEYYKKRQLVPFGEYIPLRPLLGWISKFVPIGGDFARGEDSSPLLVNLRGDAIVFGPLICYEDIYPQLARRSVLAGSSVLAVLTNNAWFDEGGAAYQHAAHSVLRAVETRRPVLRSGNGGWSGWIDEFGGVRLKVADEQGNIYIRGTRAATVIRDTRWVGRNSFYTEHGDWFVLACLGLMTFGLLALKLGEVPVAQVAEPIE